MVVILSESKKMSRSRRNPRAIDEPRSNNHRKMSAYTLKGKAGKFLPEKDMNGNISRTAKLVAKNANRSKKKSVRQQAKRDITDQLDSE